MPFLRDNAVFVSQFFRQYHTTGSVLPSSRALAKALCRFVDGRALCSDAIDPHGEVPAANNGADATATSHPGCREILEVGPGTGAVTAKLVTKLRPQDRLTLVELNDDFVAHLRRRFTAEPDFAAVAERTTIVHDRLEALADERRYDVIISGLPLNNFEVNEVEQILGIFQRLLRPGGTLSFFEYIFIRRVKALTVGRAGRQRLRGIGAALDRVLNGREIKRDWVWPNVPPAWVHHVRFE